jgi:hypothetical protein
MTLNTKVKLLDYNNGDDFLRSAGTDVTYISHDVLGMFRVNRHFLYSSPNYTSQLLRWDDSLRDSEPYWPSIYEIDYAIIVFITEAMQFSRSEGKLNNQCLIFKYGLSYVINEPATVRLIVNPDHPCFGRILICENCNNANCRDSRVELKFPKFNKISEYKTVGMSFGNNIIRTTGTGDIINVSAVLLRDFPFEMNDSCIRCHKYLSYITDKVTNDQTHDYVTLLGFREKETSIHMDLCYDCLDELESSSHRQSFRI